MEVAVGRRGSDRRGRGKWFLLIKKGKRSIVPTTVAIAVDAIKIRRIRPATLLSQLLQPEGQLERKRPHPGGFVVASPISDQRERFMWS